MGAAAARLRGLARRAARPGLGLAIVALLGGNLFLATHWNHSTPVTLAQSVEQFRQSQAPSAAEAGASTATTAPPVTVAPPTGPRTSTSVARQPSAAQTQAATSHSQSPGSSAFTKPAPGVYAYATTGFEKVSFGNARHDYPAETFAAVRPQDGCRWEMEHRLLEEHVETSRYCGAPNVLSFLSSTVDITFFGQKEHRTVTCNPPEITVQSGDPVGARRQFVCTMDGGGGQSDETVTYAGREVLTVGGVAVQTFHAVIDGKQSGEAEGTSRMDVWVHPMTGLLIKEIVHVQTRSHAFGQTIDYTQDASHTLKSLTPAT